MPAPGGGRLKPLKNRRAEKLILQMDSISLVNPGAFAQKYNFRLSEKYDFLRASRSTRGAYRDRHERWMRDAVDATVCIDEARRSGRRNRVVLIPRCWDQVCRR
jgi:hypothetical protein